VSDATREKVLAAAEQLNYGGPDPRAQSLRRGRSGIVGVVLEESVSDAFRDPMNIATLDGIADALGPSGSALLLLTDHADGPSSIRTVPLDGVVLIGCSTRLADAVQVFRQRGVPIVGVETEPMDGVLSVDLDNREGTRVLAEHLRDLGHRDVAMVTLPLDSGHTAGWLTAERETASEGYTATQRILGARDVFPSATGYSAAGSTVDEGHRAALEVLAGPDRPTAIVAQSDLLAVGVIRGAQELGLRVPEDLSVVGFDGVRLDGIAPIDLTTMVQPAFGKGRAAGAGVLAILEGEPTEPVTFTSEFHRGATTAAPRVA
jgi:DNA-binding LacI/PurR family transcriptional regulator